MGENIAIRDAYGTALKELGEQNEKIVGLGMDVASSTKSGIFGKAFPEHYFNAGISELDVVSVSAGFARERLIPYVSASTVFLATRGVDPIQNLIAYDELNVKLRGTYCGLSDSYDGTSHQAITGLAFVRVIPNMAVVAVADAVETRKAVFAIAEYQGPVCLRFSRATTPVFYPEDMKFEIGRGITAREGGGVAIITTGTVLHKILAVAELLGVKGIQARVVDMHIIKPTDEELIIEHTRETGAIMTVEEHSVCGGLGSAVTEVLAEHISVPMTRIGAADFTRSGNYKQLLVKYGYGPGSIAERCEKVMKRKQV